MNPASDPNRHFPAAYLAAEQRNEEGWIERLPGRRPWLGPETGDTSLGEHNHSNSQEGINRAAWALDPAKKNRSKKQYLRQVTAPIKHREALPSCKSGFRSLLGGACLLGVWVVRLAGKKSCTPWAVNPAWSTREQRAQGPLLFVVSFLTEEALGWPTENYRVSL